MSGDDELKGFVERGQAAQAAVDATIDDNNRATLAEVLARLQAAAVFAVAPAPTTSRPALSDLFADALAWVLPKVTAKNRTEVARAFARLERSVRAELERAFSESLVAGNRVAGAGGDAATRWAYQAGTLHGSMLAFLGSRARGGGER